MGSETLFASRPTDEELIDALERAVKFYQHIDHKRVFRPGSQAATQVLLDAVELAAFAVALREHPIPGVTNGK